MFIVMSLAFPVHERQERPNKKRFWLNLVGFNYLRIHLRQNLLFATPFQMADPNPSTHVDDDEMPDETPGYKVAEKRNLEDIVKADAEDESLRKYKEQLLGAAASGEVASSDDPRHIIIDDMRIKVDGREDIVVPVSAHAILGVVSDFFYKQC